MFRFTKQMFMVMMLAGAIMFWWIIGYKFVSMINHPCMVRPTLNDLNPDEFHYYPFINIMNRCNGSYNTLENPVSRIYFPNKMEDVNLKELNMIRRDK